MATTYATLAELRLHASIPTDQTDLLQDLLDTAADWIDQHCMGIADSASAGYFADVKTATDELYSGDGGTNLRLRRRPVVAITTVKVSDATIDSTLYTLVDGGWLACVNTTELDYNPRLWRNDDQSGLGMFRDSKLRWPHGDNNVKVTYTYGYSAVPNKINLACRHLARHWYLRDRSEGIRSESQGPRTVVYGDDSDCPPNVLSLLSAYVQREVGY